MSGTTAKEQKINFHIEGMSCTNCALGISKYLEKKGFDKVQVNFATGIAAIEIEEKTEIEEAKQHVEKLGFKVINIEGVEDTSTIDLDISKKGFAPSITKSKFHFSELFSLPVLLFICAVLSLPLLLGMFLPFAFLHNPYVQLALATPVFLIGWMYFGRSAFHSLRAGIPNMDVLVILGATAAFGFSSVALFIEDLGQGIYFETASIIITFVLLGKYMEHRAVQKTTTAINELTQLQKVKAKRIIDIDGAEVIEQVEAHVLQKNNVVLVNTGDNIPADGQNRLGNCFGR